MANSKKNPFGGKQAKPFGNKGDGKDTSGKKPTAIKGGMKRFKGGM